MFEIKIASIVKTDSKVYLTVRLYNTEGPIPVTRPGDPDSERYDRTLLLERSYTLNRPISRAQIVNFLRSKMEQYNDAHGTVYGPGDFFVNITQEATGLE